MRPAELAPRRRRGPGNDHGRRRGSVAPRRLVFNDRRRVQHDGGGRPVRAPRSVARGDDPLQRALRSRGFVGRRGPLDRRVGAGRNSALQDAAALADARETGGDVAGALERNGFERVFPGPRAFSISAWAPGTLRRARFGLSAIASSLLSGSASASRRSRPCSRRASSPSPKFATARRDRKVPRPRTLRRCGKKHGADSARDARKTSATPEIPGTRQPGRTTRCASRRGALRTRAWARRPKRRLASRRRVAPSLMEANALARGPIGCRR